jgi:hypothetical protein
LLGAQEDKICLDYIGIYFRFLNEDLFLFSMEHNNE